ncbi:MAG: polysaccharide biosynthesis protein [Oscillospiraceae bacterium]|nr:polysaccharide biosynthesis protein [Oscillospiraceae bacterium]
MKERRQTKAHQSVLNGAMILTVAIALTKVIGAMYRLPLGNAFKMQGTGFFSDAYNLYTPIFAVATTGLPIAVSRMVAERMALGKYRDVQMLLQVTKRLFLLTGLAASALMFLLAYPYAKWFCADLDSLPAVLCVAPSIFFCCAMSIYRGYYEGLRNMIPTSASQVIEALSKLVLGLVLTNLLWSYGEKQYERTGTVFGKVAATPKIASSMLYPWAAAAAILGVTAGSIFGLLYLMIRHRARGDGITREELINSGPPESSKVLTRQLIVIAVPMLLSSLILNFTNLIDSVTMRRLLAYIIEHHEDVVQSIYGTAFENSDTVDSQRSTYIWGIYNTVLNFRNLVPTIITSLGISALPAISAAWALRRKEAVQKVINSILRISMMVALPAGFGMAVLAKEILTVMYGRENPDMIVHAVPLMQMFGVATALMSVSSPITSMLQGIGRTDVPVKSLIAGALVKVAANFLFVGNASLNIKGAAISSVLCYIVIVSINLVALLRTSRTKLNLGTVLWKPLFATLLCTLAAWSVNGLVQYANPMGRLLHNLDESKLEMLTMLASMSLAMIAAVAVYGVAMLLIKGVSEDDLEILPGGKKLGKTLAKLGLLG